MTPELIAGLAQVPYIYQPSHQLLAPDAHRAEGPNIGRAGEHLTISFICQNRAHLSIRLLQSIEQWLPDFRGEILIVDQASSPGELDQIRAACAKMTLRTRIVELSDNYGVAGGRNRTMPHVTTDWVMCLDNDMVFVANPLWAIQHDLATLGAHFLNLPLLDIDRQRFFALGGHLYPGVADGEINIGAGSAYAQAEAPPPGNHGPPFLSTFLFGGASVLNRATFLALGGYDENMFIGFEDIDFSIRLFQAGQKVGNSRVVCLVHDHPPPETNTDRDYERQRFSRETIHESARYLERKHGLKVWTSGLEDWLRTREAELRLGADEPEERPAQVTRPASTPVGVDERPRIALVTDTDTWAFWNISRQLEQHLSDRFRFEIIPTAVIENVVQVFLLARQCDLIHVFWREYLGLLHQPHVTDYLRYLGSDPATFIDQELRARVLSTCIYDHLHLEAQALDDRRWIFRDLVHGYYVGSERLRRIYAGVADWPRPRAVLPDGVDPGLFYPQHLDRFDHLDRREIVIGWTGNSNWAGEIEDFKGVNTILRPAVESLIAEGLPLRLQLADRAAGGPMIPHEEMVHYYGSIDLYICTSKIEGTPNPVLESLACGVPIISTDVGVVPEAFGPRQHQFILAERSVPCLQAALRRLVGQRELFRQLSRENLEQSRNWHWAKQTQGFATYFAELLATQPRAVGSAG